MHDYKSNRDLLDEFNLYVHGHEDAKKGIINLVNKSKIRYHQRHISMNTEYELIEPHKLLLVAPSGQGKTHLVETASRIMDFPLMKLDACSLAPTSASGGIDATKLKKMITLKAESLVNTKKKYHSKQGAIDQMVIFIDEIDKLCKPADSSGRWNIHVQENFLTMFDAKDSYAGISFIFAGAFTGLDEMQKTKTLGFVHDTEIKEDTTDWSDEIVKYGLIPELMGRLNGIHKLDLLTKNDYRHILLDLLIPKKKEELLYYHCTDFNLSKEQIDKIIDKALKSGQGVRSLKRELNKITADVEFFYEDRLSESADNQTLLLENMQSRYQGQNKD